MAEGEMRGFVFSLVFIIVFSTLLSSIPVGLHGIGSSPDTVVPVDPSLLTGFSETENYTKAAYSPSPYEYSLGGRDWLATANGVVELGLFAKILLLGFIWLGALDQCKFISSEGVDRGTLLALTEIDADDTNGTHRYDLRYTSNGDSAGKLVIYWNTTLYPAIADAWNNNALHILHGMGIEDTATDNIGALIVSLLFFQLPNVPVLINMFLAVPLWACIVYLLWYLITSMIPFVGGS